jgi:hypothetical protein
VKVLAGNPRRFFVGMKLPHIRIVGRLASRRFADVRAERPKITAKPDLIVKADLLIAEENDLILNKGACSSSTCWLDRGRVRSILPISAPICGDTGSTVMVS